VKRKAKLKSVMLICYLSGRAAVWQKGKAVITDRQGKLLSEEKIGLTDLIRKSKATDDFVSWRAEFSNGSWGDGWIDGYDTPEGWAKRIEASSYEVKKKGGKNGG